MGAISDALNVGVGPGEAAALASAVCVWLRTRKSDVKVRFRNGDREVEVRATNLDSAEQLIRLVKEEEA
jgi:hypothetical protein